MYEAFEHLLSSPWTPQSVGDNEGLEGSEAERHNEEERCRYNEELRQGPRSNLVTGWEESGEKRGGNERLVDC